MKILILTNILAILLFVVLLCILYYCYIYWKYRTAFKYFPFFPYPFIGHSSIFIGSHGDTLDIINKLISDHKDSPLAALLGHKLVWVITTPEDVETITTGSHALQKSSIYKLFSYIQDGIFTTRNLHQWRKNRKRIVSTLNHKVLNTYVNIFYELSDIFCQKLGTHSGKGNFPIFPLAYDLTVDIITRTIFNINIEQQTKTSDLPIKFERVSQIFYDRIHKPWKHSDHLFNLYSESREYYRTIKYLRGYLAQRVLEQRIECNISKDAIELDDNKLKPTIKLLVELSETDEELSDKQIIDELWTLFVAGSDSTAITTSFVLTLLGMHEDIQDKVYEELRDVLGEDHRAIVAEDLGKMKLLERVIKETLRIFPIGPIFGRVATEDIALKDYTIHKDEEILLNIFYMQRSEKYWKNPLCFNPDRFLPENIAKVHSCAWTPFSTGARNCVGVKFGMMSLKVVLANALRKFKFHCKKVPLDKIRLQTEVMLKAVDGNVVSVNYRH